MKSRVRTIQLFCLFVLLVGIMIENVESQSIRREGEKRADYSVRLSSKIENIEGTIQSTDILFSVNYEMTLANTGSKPVIFLKEIPPEIRGWGLTKRSDDPLYDKPIFFSYFGESVDTSSKWNIFRNELNQSSPPLDKVHILMPNESWKWRGNTFFTLPKQKKSNLFETESWENIKDLPEVWLHAICQVWSLNIEPKSNDRSDFVFGKKLQKRWKDVGLLWLDDIRSEPIPLDLNSVVMKTDSES